MSAATGYGQWLPLQLTQTGACSTYAMGMKSLLAIDDPSPFIRTGQYRQSRQSIPHINKNQHTSQHSKQVVRVEKDVVAQHRTPAEDLVRIREIIKPAVSDLAKTFGVSRQSIYNWLNGEPIADENAAKLKDLANAADIFENEGLVMNATLLKRKFANGRTLLQVAHFGGSASDAAVQLVRIYKHEMAQREQILTRFANRPKTPATADFDLPHSNDDYV